MSRTDVPPQAAGVRSAVTIRRDHPEDAWRRRISARVDTGARHELGFGNSITIELTPGDHSLYTGQSLFRRTVRFAVAPGEHAKFTLVGRSPVPGLHFLARVSFIPGLVKVLRAPRAGPPEARLPESPSAR